MDKEPSIIINGTQLTPAQAMTVRVALESFAGTLTRPESLGKDEHGLYMREAYLRCVKGIREALYRGAT